MFKEASSYLEKLFISTFSVFNSDFKDCRLWETVTDFDGIFSSTTGSLSLKCKITDLYTISIQKNFKIIQTLQVVKCLDELNQITYAAISDDVASFFCCSSCTIICKI